MSCLLPCSPACSFLYILWCVRCFFIALLLSHQLLEQNNMKLSSSVCICAPVCLVQTRHTACTKLFFRASCSQKCFMWLLKFIRPNQCNTFILLYSFKLRGFPQWVLVFIPLKNSIQRQVIVSTFTLYSVFCFVFCFMFLWLSSFFNEAMPLSALAHLRPFKL